MMKITKHLHHKSEYWDYQSYWNSIKILVNLWKAKILLMKLVNIEGMKDLYLNQGIKILFIEVLSNLCVCWNYLMELSLLLIYHVASRTNFSISCSINSIHLEHERNQLKIRLLVKIRSCNFQKDYVLVYFQKSVPK